MQSVAQNIEDILKHFSSNNEKVIEKALSILDQFEITENTLTIRIHRGDCENIINLSRKQQTQLIKVSWNIDTEI